MPKNLKRYKWTALLGVLLVIWLLFGTQLITTLLEDDVDVEQGVPTNTNLSGRILYTQQENGILSFDFATESASVFWLPEDGYLVDGMTTSPDQSQLLIAYGPIFNEGVLGNTDLYLMDVTTQAMTPFLMRDDVTHSYRDPFWSPDGEWVYYTHYSPIINNNGATVGINLNIERIRADGTGQSEVLATDAEQVAVSPDNNHIVYLGYDTSTFLQSVWMADADGSNPIEVVGSGTFAIMGSPRFTPDREMILFSASGDTQDPLPELFDLNVAYAHGAPWELWQIDRNGDNLQRITNGGFDDVTLNYAPDNSAIAFMDVKTLFILLDSTVYSLETVSIDGAVVWLAE